MVELSRRCTLLLCLLLLPSLADAANKYVRPLGGSYGAETGGTYAAAYDGAVLALAGVSAGDTLYVCGAHTEKFATQGSGTSVAQIVLDGACPGDPGSIIVGSGDTAAFAQAFGVGESYWTVQNLTLSGGTVAPIYCNGNSPNCTGNIYQDNILICTHSSSLTSGIRLRSGTSNLIRRNTITGSNAVCQYSILMDTTETADATLINNIVSANDVSAFKGPCIRFAGVSSANPLPGPNYVQNNLKIHDCGDGIYHVNADSITNSGNVSYGHTRVNGSGEGYCYASTWANLGVWDTNEGYGCRGKGLEVFADNVARVLTGVTIQGNYFHGNNVGAGSFICSIDVNNGLPPTATWSGVIVRANLSYNESCGINIAPGVVGVIESNTLVNCLTEACLITEGSADGLSIKNNLLKPSTALYAMWINAPVGVANTIKGNFYDTGGTANLAHVNTTNYTSGTITSVDPNAVTGAALLTADFKLKPTSPARWAGVSSPYCRDARGRTFCWTPPDIGWKQMTSGDPPSTRSVHP